MKYQLVSLKEKNLTSEVFYYYYYYYYYFEKKSFKYVI
jgi:hypothetical protein